MSMKDDTSSDDDDQHSKVRVVTSGGKWDKTLTSLLHFLDAEWMRTKIPSKKVRRQEDVKGKLGPAAWETMVDYVRKLVTIIAEGLCPEDSLRLAQEVTSTVQNETFKGICADLFKLYDASKKASTDRRVSRLRSATTTRYQDGSVQCWSLS